MGRVRLGGATAIVLAAIVVARPAGADDLKAECVASHEEAQRLTEERRFRAAREQLLVCGRPACPRATQTDCLGWLSSLDARTPTVVILAKDATGHDLEAVKVSVDGQPLRDRIDGRPDKMDPGPHDVRFEHDGQVVVEHVVIAEGDKLRTIQGAFQAPPSVEPEAPPPRAGIPTVSWILGGVSVVALGMFIGFAASGKSGESCVPTCTRDDVDGFRRDYLVADVSLGISLVAAGAAIYFALTNKPSPPAGAPAASR